MAHAEKFTKGAVFGIANHIERKTENHSNEEIDSSRTKDNYSLLSDESDLISRLNNRLEEVHVYNRKDVNVMVNWVVTLPNELREATEEDKRAFFSNTHDFLVNRYGGLKNVVSSEVHVDEKTPHLHFSFVPVVFDEKRQQERVQANKVIDRKELKVFHDELHEYLVKKIPGIYQEGILNGNTIGLDKVEDIKKLDKKIKEAKQERQETLKEVTAYKNPVKQFDEIIRNSSRSLRGAVQLSEDDLNEITNLVLGTAKMTDIHAKFKSSSEKQIDLLEQKNNKYLSAYEMSEKKAKTLDSRVSDLENINESLESRARNEENLRNMLDIWNGGESFKEMQNLDSAEYGSLMILSDMKQGKFKPTLNNLTKAREHFEKVPRHSKIYKQVLSALDFVKEKLNELTQKVNRSKPRL